MRSLLRGVLALAFIGVTADSVQAQRFGVQLSWGDDVDLGVGGRAEFDLGELFAGEGAFGRMFGIGSFDYFFPDGFDYWEINVNGAVPLAAEAVDPYLGAGLNLARVSVDTGFGDASDTELGLNVLGGLRFLLGTLSAFAEARIELGGGEQFVLTGGVLLGGTR